MERSGPIERGPSASGAGALGRSLAEQVAEHRALRALYDRRVRMAARLLRAPVSLAVLLDDEHAHMVGRYGTDSAPKQPREEVIASHVVQRRELLACSDLRTHAELRGREVPRREGWVAYLGVPLHADGECIGAVSVLDRRPRRWTQRDITMLTDIAEVIDESIVLQRQVVESAAELGVLADSEQLYRSTFAAMAEGVVIIDDAGVIVDCNAAAEQILERPASEICGTKAHDGWALRRADGSPLRHADRPSVAAREHQRVVEDRVLQIELPRGTRWLTVNSQPLDRRAGAVITFADVTARWQVEQERDRQLREQQALGSLAGSLAVLVASDAQPRAVFAASAQQAALALDATCGAMIRHLPASEPRIVGSWAAAAEQAPELGQTVGLTDGCAASAVLRTGQPAHRIRTALDSTSGLRMELAVPVSAGNALWGVIAVGFRDALDEVECDRRLMHLTRVAELIGLGVSGSEARESLAQLASTDHLTGLPNHRAFTDRIDEEVRRAHRHGRALSLVVVDVDHFKSVNDTFGHAVGNETLRQFGERLRSLRRGSELVARVGGEEFGWLLPEADAEGAIAAAERARQSLADEPFPLVGRITASFGVCDLPHAADAAEMFRHADLALYRAKSTGRNRVCAYRGEGEEFDAGHERRIRDAATLAALRALATAVDAKDPSTQRHSERVADLAAALARLSGWSAGEAALLHDAALVHDVGKIGVPDAVLLKPGRLDADEFAQVKQHAELGADIVGEVLGSSQVAWVRHHHERFDGRGYPDGLKGHDIETGARLLALADSWDAMTVARPYGAPKTVQEALEEVRRGAGSQFCPEAVELLLALHESSEHGLLDPGHASR